MSEDWIRTTNLCYQKRPLYRPLLLALFLGALFCRSKVESSLFIDWYLVTHIVQCWKDRTLGPRYIAIYFQDPYLLYKRSLFPRGQFKHSCWRCNVLYLLIPFIFWIIKEKYTPRHGYYLNYNRIQINLIKINLN